MSRDGADTTKKSPRLRAFHNYSTSDGLGEVTLSKFLRRPETTWATMVAAESELAGVSDEVAEQVMNDLKYEGYVARQQIDVERQGRLAEKRIPDRFDYGRITQLRAEAREKLTRIRPVSLAQASRISGVTPADVALVMMYLQGKCD